MADGRPPSPPGVPERPLLPRRRRAPTLILLAVLAIAIALAAGRHRAGRGAIPSSKPPLASQQFGANTGRLFNDRTYSPAQIQAQLQALHATGATLARSDAPWEATEPAPPSGGIHHYDWSFDDTIAGALASNDLTWLPIIDYSAPWARSIPSRDHSAPDPSEYAAYAAALAQRYGSGGTFWQAHPSLPQHPVDTYEIWNEPDNPVFWSPQPNATAYADLYLRSRDAIDAVAPGARVIVGGLTRPATFIPEVMAAAPALRNQLDGVGIHPYGADPQAVLTNLKTARSTLQSLGLGSVPLYVTEFGWTTSPPDAHDYLPGRLRPGYIEQTLSQLGHTNCGLTDVLLYAWVTPQKNPADAQDWFGVHPPGGGGSPDTDAFAQGLQAATAPAPTAGVC